MNYKHIIKFSSIKTNLIGSLRKKKDNDKHDNAISDDDDKYTLNITSDIQLYFILNIILNQSKYHLIYNKIYLTK